MQLSLAQKAQEEKNIINKSIKKSLKLIILASANLRGFFPDQIQHQKFNRLIQKYCNLITENIDNTENIDITEESLSTMLRNELNPILFASYSGLVDFISHAIVSNIFFIVIILPIFEIFAAILSAIILAIASVFVPCIFLFMCRLLFPGYSEQQRNDCLELCARAELLLLISSVALPIFLALTSICITLLGPTSVITRFLTTLGLITPYDEKGNVSDNVQNPQPATLK